MSETFIKTNLFQLTNSTYKINKSIRLIELFGGIGAQAKALENINANFEIYKYCDFDKYAVCSYNAIHNTNFSPSDITKISGKDLEIVDKDIYIYICTYSFPCQDLSVAGKRKGMSKETQTRSSLLWEVERILNELKVLNQLPQILLMENVPQVISDKNFKLWLKCLNNLGYTNYYKVLNAKDYQTPQNRRRCFMLSILDNKLNLPYVFPSKLKLKTKLSDLLENKIDEKYFLSKKSFNYLIAKNSFDRYRHMQTTLTNTMIKDIALTITTKPERSGGNFILTSKIKECDLENIIKDIKLNKLKIRKLTPKECWRLMGFTDNDFDKSKNALNKTFYKNKDKSDTQLYKQAGNSIVVSVLENIFKELL